MMRNPDFPGHGPDPADGPHGFGPASFGPEGFGPGGRRGPGGRGPAGRDPEGRGGGRGRRRDDDDDSGREGRGGRGRRGHGPGGGHEGHPHGGPFGGPEALRAWLSDPANVPDAVREWLTDPANIPWGPGPRMRGGRGRRGPRGFGRPGGWQQGDLPGTDDIESWFTGRLPEDWFSDVEVTVDREEIVVMGTLADTDELAGAEAEGRISRFRSDTRATRMEIADEAQQRYRRKVSWGARAGDVEQIFTNVSVPVMTRLRQPERRVLDTLVDAGVARSRSEALSWAVKLVGQHTEAWLNDLREAMAAVDRLRAEGPTVDDDMDDESDDEPNEDTRDSDRGES